MAWETLSDLIWDGINRIMQWLTVENILNVVVIFVYIIIILLIGIIINRITTDTINKALGERVEKGTLRQLLRFKKYLVYGVVLLLILGVFGISGTALATTFGFLGLAIGFAARDVISNFLAGIILLVERQYTIGDVIKVGETVGIVRMTKIRTTEIETFDGNLVSVPNATIFSSEIINMTGGSDLIQSTVWAKVAYEADIEKVKQLMKEAAKEVEGARVDKKHEVKFEIKGVNNQWGLRVQMLFYLKAHREPWIRSNVQQKVTQKIVEADIPLHTLASRPSK
ncbi:MAG: mechanosensitive ion channel family protein [Candidatus Korarchaeota archaeon]|nr:mechanosensitive ion channel family protein [Candidatus Korarchaeota archaeon]NIU83968.1 mechanosensitive ion channel [Candidatus Thorarchaeota archaeon]NIW14092.1 mechanosensitive ion channel [Candidatus Thorarchaeota archaeon]NIW52202.1 mechanosensitive ion channel [Candidatus Korarchaeota archaeon]